MNDEAEEDDPATTDDIIPEKADVGRQECENDNGLRKDCGPKNRVPPDFFQIKSNQENAENSAIEDGPDDIDKLDEIFEQAPIGGKENGEATPDEGEDA